MGGVLIATEECARMCVSCLFNPLANGGTLGVVDDVVQQRAAYDHDI